jgi:valyl-tRNA synthetase
MRLGVCSRSNDVIEPMIKPQWYVNCSDIAKEALHAVTDEENKRVEIIPKQYVADWKRCLYIHCLPFIISYIEYGYPTYFSEHSSEMWSRI